MSGLNSSETDLFVTLFTNYQPEIRPKRSADYVTNVTVYLSVFSLLSMDEQMQAIRFTTDVSLKWIDPLLIWNSSRNTALKIPEETLWTPDIMFYAATSNDDLIPYGKRMVLLRSDGEVVKSGPQIVSHPCQIDVTQFPYDVQTCRLSLGSWSFTSSNLRINTPNDSYEVSDDFTANSEWELLSLTAMMTIDTSYEIGDYDVLVLSVRLRRNSEYYSLCVVVPTFVCTFLCLNGLFLPSEISGLNIEKVSLGVCTLLAMALILESVTASIPKSKDLGVFVLAETFLCAIAVLVTSFYLFAHERAITRGWIPPTWLSVALLNRRYDRKITHRNISQQHGKRYGLTHIYPYLVKIVNYLSETASDARLEQMWGRIFDRINVFTLIFFQLANLVMSLVILL
ncbi:hypothetical protein Q1695_002137 [Nippostrongylus brasiliensis]|nr:hypothetical protein Q1695_002137 [Nippostrongylus brasiliensis]